MSPATTTGPTCSGGRSRTPGYADWMPRTDKIPNSTRRRILAEAASLFRRHGYRGTSTRQIAEAVGVKQPSLFHHFPNKQAILEELLAISLDDSLARAQHAASAPGPVARRLYD